jgi:hypothetical protein
MKSTSSWPHLGEPAGPDDPFADLRASYYARLRNDITRLRALHTQLSSSEMDPKGLHESIYLVAHGMAGAAAIFQVTEVLNAAIALEQATLAAIKAHPGTDDASVCAALDALTDLLQNICGIRMAHTA